MSEPSGILRRSTADRNELLFWCPGCDTPHHVQVGVGAGPRWDWNGDAHAPTFTPSILVTCGRIRPRADLICHSFVAQGVIDFLEDSSNHQLRGKHQLPAWPYPDWSGTEPALDVDA